MRRSKAEEIINRRGEGCQTEKTRLRARIAKGRYLTLNAARQTGKTTIFREVIAELEATGEYFGILLDFESLADLERVYFYEALGQELARWRTYEQPTVPDPGVLRHQVDLIQWLRATNQMLGKKGVLIIDEFDAVDTEIIKPILSLFRGMYLEKNLPQRDALHSIILVGVRNLPSLLEGTQSPFNIADQFTIPYFDSTEVADLLGQYTVATGQAFAPETIEQIVQETEGQPFLVNRLAQLLTQDLTPDPNQPIGLADLVYALARLLHENNTHFYSLLSKATPHRDLLMPMLLYAQSRTDFLDPATQELIMYGVLRVIEEKRQPSYARIGNPIYRKVLLLRFIASPTPLPINGGLIQRYVENDLLNFDAILDHCKAFMQEHGVRLLKSPKTDRPLEISGQYLLFSYLTAALNNIHGYVTLESISSAGEIDILAFYQGYRFIIETKIWYGPARFEEDKQQLGRYLRTAGLPKGYLVVFDEHLAANPLLTDNGDCFEITVDGKTLRIYLIDVTV